MSVSCVKEFTIGAKVKRSKEEKIKAEDLRVQKRDEDSKMVTGIFKNDEVKGGDLTFTIRLYKEDPYKTYYFEDGKTYTIPLGVAKHINTMTRQKEHAYLVDKDGKKINGIGSYRQRYTFLSTEFM
jgi:hypothetical protein